ncbi:hypothetical protein [Amycolatopsis jejuensis]|uniref:hypothetical protein n=1 Tax=Amycolatopsis jejuensis TaxID=330084 RepID=UPI0005263D82|nr:hypothetical protein [Amycolatopsis jejuensis]
MTESATATFRTKVSSPNPDADVAEIVHLHTEWWGANHGIDIPRMTPNFPVGANNYLMFNLQGHPYYGLDEKVALWTKYSAELAVPEEPVTRIVQLVVEGNAAWLAADVLFTVAEIGEEGLGAGSTGYHANGAKHRVRSTECYLRDDGTGEPSWRMWHFHCSPAPDADEPRPAFGDTARSRGELVP